MVEMDLKHILIYNFFSLRFCLSWRLCEKPFFAALHEKPLILPHENN